MKKETIEIYRHNKHIYGYGMYNSQSKVLDFDGSPKNETIMAAIIDFTKDKNIHVYNHELRYEDIIMPEYGEYKSDKLSFTIPYCDRVYWLDIYYQDKL